jgi:hypothetical protein
MSAAEDTATNASSSNKWIVIAIVAALAVAGLGYSVTRTTSPPKPKSIKGDDEKKSDAADDAKPVDDTNNDVQKTQAAQESPKKDDLSPEVFDLAFR